MTINYVSKRRPKYYGTYSLGNSKLPYTTGIFNLTSATDCPSDKLGLCQARQDGKLYCYAIKTEKMFPKSSLVYKRKQASFWDEVTKSDNYIEKFMAQFKKMHLIGPKKITHLRWNEAGDYRTQADVDKVNKIAGYLYQCYGIISYGYTARKDLDFSRADNITLMGSGFKKTGIDGEFRMVRKLSDVPNNYKVCPCDCTKCKRCIIGLDTCVVKH